MKIFFFFFFQILTFFFIQRKNEGYEIFKFTVNEENNFSTIINSNKINNSICTVNKVSTQENETIAGLGFTFKYLDTDEYSLTSNGNKPVSAYLVCINNSAKISYQNISISHRISSTTDEVTYKLNYLITDYIVFTPFSFPNYGFIKEVNYDNREITIKLNILDDGLDSIIFSSIIVFKSKLDHETQKSGTIYFRWPSVSQQDGNSLGLGYCRYQSFETEFPAIPYVVLSLELDTDSPVTEISVWTESVTTKGINACVAVTDSKFDTSELADSIGKINYFAFLREVGKKSIHYDLVELSNEFPSLNEIIITPRNIQLNRFYDGYLLQDFSVYQSLNDLFILTNDTEYFHDTVLQVLQTNDLTEKINIINSRFGVYTSDYLSEMCLSLMYYNCNGIRCNSSFEHECAKISEFVSNHYIFQCKENELYKNEECVCKNHSIKVGDACQECSSTEYVDDNACVPCTGNTSYSPIIDSCLCTNDLYYSSNEENAQCVECSNNYFEFCCEGINKEYVDGKCQCIANTYPESSSSLNCVSCELKDDSQYCCLDNQYYKDKTCYCDENSAQYNTIHAVRNECVDCTNGIKDSDTLECTDETLLRNLQETSCDNYFHFVSREECLDTSGEMTVGECVNGTQNILFKEYQVQKATFTVDSECVPTLEKTNENCSEGSYDFRCSTKETVEPEQQAFIITFNTETNTVEMVVDENPYDPLNDGQTTRIIIVVAILVIFVIICTLFCLWYRARKAKRPAFKNTIEVNY